METKKPVSENLLYITRLMRRRTPERLPDGKRPLSKGKYNVLRVLNEESPLTAKELARRMNIRPPSLTELVGLLQEDGAVLRVQDSDDLRVIHLSITDRGRALLQEASLTHAHSFDDLDHCLTEEEQQLFHDLCQKIVSTLVSSLPDEEEILRRRRASIRKCKQRQKERLAAEEAERKEKV